MDDANISKKIEALTLELAKKEKKLMRLNKQKEFRSHVKSTSASPSALNEIVANSNLRNASAKPCFSPRPPPEKQEKLYASPVSVLNKVEPASNSLCSDDNSKNTVRNHITLNCAADENKTDKTSSACDTSHIDHYDSSEKATNRENSNIIPNKPDNIQNQEEELFPDENVDSVEGEDNLVVVHDDRTFREANWEDRLRKDNFEFETSNVDNIVQNKSNSDSESFKFSDETSDNKKLRRRSSRISAKPTRNRYSGNRMKFDIKSIIDVTFDILCEMGRNSKQEEFCLPDKEYSDAKMEKIDKGSHSKPSNADFNYTTIEHYAFSDSCSIIPPTFVANSSKFLVKNYHEQSSHSSPIFSDKRLETNNYNDKTVLVPNSSILSVLKLEKNEECSDQSVNVSDTIMAKGNRDGYQNQETKACKTVMDNSKNHCNIFERTEVKLYNTQEIDAICESVVTDMVNILDNAVSSKKDDNLETPFKKVYLNCQVVQCLQKSEQDCVENVFLATEREFLIAWLQKKKALSLWKEQANNWVHLDTYTVPKTDELLDCCVFDGSLAILLKGCECSIRVLRLRDSRIQIQHHISLGSLSRAATSGSLGFLQDMGISSFLQFNGQCPQIEVHSIRPSQAASTTYIEPASDKLLCPVLCVHGLPGGLMGLSVQKLYFWNISTGLLTRTVSLQSSNGSSQMFEKCIWAKMEKGLLFGVFLDGKSEDWKLFVINPTTGLYHELCQYACPTCSAISHNKFTTHRRQLNGKVECHKLLSICTRHHMTVFDLLSAKALIASKTEDTVSVSLYASDLLVSNIDGSVCMYRIMNKK